ncbi:MAG: HAD family hydrolase, partial [Myxococcota bacterium]
MAPVSLKIRLLVCAALFTSACAGSSSTLASGASALRLELSRLEVGDGANRSLAALDVDGSGTVDGTNVEILDGLARAAREELGRRGHSQELGLLYEGPSKDQPSVFSLVNKNAGAFSFAGIKDEERLRELAIESRWAARQAAVAALGDGRVDGDAKQVKDLGARWFAELGSAEHDPSDLCERLSKLDPTAFDAAKIERVALFDLDKTVWNGSIIDPFLAVLIEDELIAEDAHPRLKTFLKTVNGIDPALVDSNSVSQNARLFRKHTLDPELPEEQRISAKDGFFETVALLNGLSRNQASDAAKKAIERGALGMPAIQSQVFDANGCSMASLISGLQSAGFVVYMLSATMDVLAFAAADALGIPRDKTIGSPLETRGDRYTGTVVMSTYGIKGSVTRAWLPSPPLVVFGDSA